MAPSSGKKGDDTIMIIVLLFIVIVGGSWAIWLTWHEQILNALRWLKVGELSLLGFFSPRHSQLADTLAGIPTKGLTTGIIGQASLIVGNIFRWPIGVALIVMAVIITFRAPGNRLRRQYGIESFISQQAEAFPVITPILKFNPGDKNARAPGSPVPDVLPPFAEALSPEEWLVFNRIPVAGNAPDTDAMRSAMLRDLGPRWRGVGRMPLYAQCLMAAFALKGVCKRKEADDLLGEISACWSPEKGLSVPGDLRRRVGKLLKDPEVGGKALKIASGHAYLTTAMMAVLEWARTNGGVLAPAQFLWLRAVARPLWYPLNNLGRHSFHAEAAASITHFMAEQKSGRPLPNPKLDAAIIAKQGYMKNPEIKLPPLAAAGRA